MKDDQGREERERATGATGRMQAGYCRMTKPIGVLSAAEALLRTPGSILYEARHGSGGAMSKSLVNLSLLSLLLYGLAVGMFSWGPQLLAAPLKITAGAFFCAILCFPSLVIFSYLDGSEATIGEIFILLLAVLALSSMLLVGFGPVSWIFSQSTESAAFMGFLHLSFWMIGLYYGLRFLIAAAAIFAGRRGRTLLVWGAIFLLVTLQMTTTLRPLVGTSDDLIQTEKKFFLTHWADTLERRR
jgi:hypothetical protein